MNLELNNAYSRVRMLLFYDRETCCYVEAGCGDVDRDHHGEPWISVTIEGSFAEVAGLVRLYHDAVKE